MDTNKQPVIETPKIPEFKLAKVGEKKRRKGAGIWFGGGGGSGGFAGAVGGSGGAGGMGGLLATLGGKMAILALIAALGVGAWSVGRGLAPDAKRFQADKKARLFADAKAEKRYAEDTSALPKDSGRDNASSIGMVSGSLDGKTAAERAAEAEAAAAAQKAKDAAAAAAAEKAGAEAPTVAGGAAEPAVDPAAMAAAAAAAAKAGGGDKGAMAKRIGGLSSSMSGGSGMSAGVTRGFDAPKFKNDNGKALAFGTGRPTTGRTDGRQVRSSVNRGGSRAMNQLNTAHKLSNLARTGSMENASSTADAAFNNNPGMGSAITGAGAGTGSGTGADAAGAGGNTTSGNPGGQPTPTANIPMDTGEDVCEGTQLNSPSGGCVDVVAGATVDPTDWMFDLLKVLSIIAAVAAGIATILSVFQYAYPWAAIVQAIISALAIIVCAVGAIMALLGLAIVAMGRPLEGAIFTVMGGLTCAAGYMMYGSAASGAGEYWTTEAITYTTVGTLTTLMNVGSSIGAHNVDSRTFNETSQKWE